MKLDEWEAISESQQKNWIIQWYNSSQWNKYESLAGEAAEELRKQMASTADVTGVEIGGGGALEIGVNGRVLELILNVCTLLPETSRLEKIPCRFKGFRVQQLNLGDKRNDFLNTCTKLFKELNGWNEEQILKWTAKWDEALSGREPSATVYHYGPLKIAVPSLIEEKVRILAGNKLNDLQNEILMLLMYPKGTEFSATLYPDTLEEYDWEAVRQKLKEIKNKYGHT
jgi:hypothetical protein